jgi:glutamine synthetase
VKHIDETLREKPVRFLDLKYCDLPGRLRHVTLPIERLSHAAADGIGFDSSSVAGFRAVESGDMVLRPDINSAFVDPFASQPTVSCFAEIFYPDSNRRYERDARFILQQAIAQVRKQTGADEIMVLPEFEFYLFNSAEFFTDQSSAVYRIETDELRHDDHSGLALFKGTAYHVAPPFDRSTDFRSELASLMAGCGIPVKYHHHEGGRYSQVEVEPLYLPALRAADAITLAKYLVRNLAFRNGKSATFMPKPIHGEPGSGMHLHQYLSRGGHSLFGDAHAPARLAKLGLHYIAGILEHMPGLCALTNPSTSSYRRLVPGFEAPVLASFSSANRTAAIRIPGYATDMSKLGIEYRIPDATANPYLALAAVLLAGLDGIRRKLDPGAPSQGRLDAQPPAPGVKVVPATLDRALQELKSDSDYLTRDGVFDTTLLEKWHELKQIEADAIARRPHPWEFNLYYGC